MAKVSDDDMALMGRLLGRGEAGEKGAARIAALLDALNESESKLHLAEAISAERLLGLQDLHRKIEALESRLEAITAGFAIEHEKFLKVNERATASESRLEHYRLALEGIVRMGSDNYGIISEAAKAADFALNAPAHDYLVKSLTEPLPAERDMRDNVALTVNKPFVVEKLNTSTGENKCSE